MTGNRFDQYPIDIGLSAVTRRRSRIGLTEMLAASELIAGAEDRVGISDSDVFVRANLERLLEALELTSGMSADGFAGAERALLMDTVNRLEGLKWLRDFPEIGLEPVVSPIVLMGLPRSGTTYLQYLFDCDDRFRQIRTWEALTPFPPPGADPAAAGAL